MRPAKAERRGAWWLLLEACFSFKAGMRAGEVDGNSVEMDSIASGASRTWLLSGSGGFRSRDSIPGAQGRGTRGTRSVNLLADDGAVFHDEGHMLDGGDVGEG